MTVSINPLNVLNPQLNMILSFDIKTMTKKSEHSPVRSLKRNNSFYYSSLQLYYRGGAGNNFVLLTRLPTLKVVVYPSSLYSTFVNTGLY